MLGIDRHGRQAFAQASLVRTEMIHKPVALGTSGAFGLFHPDCRVALASGERVRVGSIVSRGRTVSDVRFEIMQVNGPKAGLEACYPEIWASMARRSFAAGEERLFVAESKIPSIGFPDRSVRPADGSWSIFGPQLKATFAAADAEAQRAAVKSIFANSGDGGRSYSLLANEAHHALNLRDWDASLRFIFDTLQHSYSVSLAPENAPHAPMQPGRTNFLWPRPAVSCRLLWGERSWRPLVNGFLAEGD